MGWWCEEKAVYINTPSVEASGRLSRYVIEASERAIAPTSLSMNPPRWLVGASRALASLCFCFCFCLIFHYCFCLCICFCFCYCYY